MTIITLTTDFGERDGYVGVMKGVIWGIAPQVRFADLTHLVTPQNITEGALVLGRSWRYFPAGTIHLAIVDPGVGTNRRALAARIGEHFFVGPDNGLVTPLVMDARNLGWPVSFLPPQQAPVLAAQPKQRVSRAGYLLAHRCPPGQRHATGSTGG